MICSCSFRLWETCGLASHLIMAVRSVGRISVLRATDMLIHPMKFVKAFHLCHDGSLRYYKKRAFLSRHCETKSPSFANEDGSLPLKFFISISQKTKKCGFSGGVKHGAVFDMPIQSPAGAAVRRAGRSRPIRFFHRARTYSCSSCGRSGR